MVTYVNYYSLCTNAVCKKYVTVKCHPAWENRAYVHKIHPLTLFHLPHLLCKLYEITLNFLLFAVAVAEVSLMHYA